MNDVKQRLLEFISYLGIKKNAFEQTIGMSNGFVNNTNSRMTKRSLDAISSAYPQLNTDWLISGRGEMLIEGVPPFKHKDSELSPEIEALVSRIDRLLEQHERDSKNMSRLLDLLYENRGLNKESAVG